MLVGKRNRCTSDQGPGACAAPFCAGFEGRQAGTTAGTVRGQLRPPRDARLGQSVKAFGIAVTLGSGAGFTSVSLTPELERVVNEKVESGITTASVVREALRLWKKRDEARAHLRADVQGGFDQVARRRASVRQATGRQVAERIKSKGRAARAREPSMPYRLSVLAERDLTDVSAGRTGVHQRSTLDGRRSVWRFFTLRCLATATETPPFRIHAGVSVRRFRASRVRGPGRSRRIRCVPRAGTSSRTGAGGIAL